MSELKTLVPKLDRSRLDQRLAGLRFGRPPEPKQRRTMFMALALLLVALGFVLYHDRDFWFPETQSAQGQQQEKDQAKEGRDSQQSSTPAVATPAPAVAASRIPANKKSHSARPQATANPPAESDPPFAVIANRTVLPPLEVEVVAGNVHRTLHPGANSVRVDLQPDPQADLHSGSQPDLQPGVPPEAAARAASEPASSAPDSAASVVNSAAERVQMSADTDDVVSSPVKPGYPLLARQMKVQGSVILQALISKNGAIQNLRVISGPPILAAAAQDAVRQWHFKPHYQGSEAVETQAKITVNFTISTN
jgi:protein TonB